MAKNRLDLTGLGNLAALVDGNEPASNGEPLDLSIDDVIEDPDQPRKYFPKDSIESLATQILASKSKKIRSPISVKAKNADGKYVINHGARRYRSTIRAGMTTIPAFIDETHDDYDQVAENVQREDLSPLEIAMFIQKRLTKGDKKGVIAAKLGQKASFVSEHLPLVDAPEFIQVLARDKSVGVRTLYDLIKAHTDFPDEAEAYVAATAEVTRAGVAALIQELKAPATPETNAAPKAVETPVHIKGDDQQAATDGAQADGSGSDDAKGQGAAENGVVTLTGNGKGGDKVAEPANGQQPAVTAVPKAAKRLAIIVKDGERMATVMHSRRVEIIYKDTGEVAEIDLAAIQVVGTEVISHEENSATTT